MDFNFFVTPLLEEQPKLCFVVSASVPFQHCRSQEITVALCGGHSLFPKELKNRWCYNQMKFTGVYDADEQENKKLRSQRYRFMGDDL